MLKSRTKMLVVGGVGVAVSAAFVFLDMGNSCEITEYQLKRSEEGNGNREEELHYIVGEGESGNITLDIPEAVCTDAEAEAILEEALKRLDTEILGKNESLMKIDHDLKLMSALSGSPVTISWSSGSLEMVDDEGLLGSNIPDGGTVAQLEGELTLQGHSMLYQREICVYPPAAENVGERLQRMAQVRNQNAKSRVFYLPEELDGQKVVWERKRTNNGMTLLILTAAAIICMYALERRKKTRRLEQRKEQMMEDYPEIISKLLLLLGAGLSIRKSFERIASDYGEKQVVEKNGVRHAYEEISTACREMKSGTLELTAYENLGKRCGCLAYKNLTTLLSQNLKKGSRGLIGILEREAQEAFAERRRRAKVKGDKAQTQLLLPMVMMLAVVLVILMVPAYASFAA